MPGNLGAGGRLEMLAVADAPRADLSTGQKTGAWRPVSWTPIVEPNPTGTAPDSVHAQGRRAGGASFARLEGAWYGDGRIYFVSTTGGDAAAGQVWEYDPPGERLRLLFESPGVEVLDMPDNLCVSPHGGIILCEDGPGPQLHPVAHAGTAISFPLRRTTSSLPARGTASSATSGDASSPGPRTVPMGSGCS